MSSVNQEPGVENTQSEHHETSEFLLLPHANPNPALIWDANLNCSFDAQLVFPLYLVFFFLQRWAGAQAELPQHCMFLPWNRVHFAFLSLGTSEYFSKLHIILLVLFPVSKTSGFFYINVPQFSTISKLCRNSEKYRPSKGPCGNPPTAFPGAGTLLCTIPEHFNSHNPPSFVTHLILQPRLMIWFCVLCA